MNEIENLLRHSIGLHAATIGSSVVEHTVRSRMRRLGLESHHDYLNLLRKSPAEWNNLVETMVVTETWFFREKQPFAALVRLVIEEWLPAHPNGVLRLLSIPCSSGEEPYSIAMSLMDAGFPAARFSIDAVDISARALAFARRAVYGRNSFRGGALEFRDRHFTPSRGDYSLNAAVRHQVRFWRGNILHENCLAGAGAYDFIFCRNLLIYFDRPTQDKTLAKLRGMLLPGGVLFTGAAELPIALARGFSAMDLPFGFACRKKSDRVGTTRTSRRTPAKAKSVGEGGSGARSAPPLRSGQMAPQNPATQPVAGLDAARQLIDEGRLAEAVELCETHLREYGVSADAFFLLGSVRDAAGADTQAGECYRKALYLEPGHQETLHQWASLSERNGRPEHARILRKRAERRSSADPRET
jgi:chemotaxis protein methyltransferase WspC